VSDLTYIETYLEETAEIGRTLDRAGVASAIGLLRDLRREGGRLFILGVGGSAGNASHAVNDFRKIAGIECYAPTDNVSELTAWTNDVGWEVVFQRWLQTSHVGPRDAVMVFSVGGGSATTSRNLVLAMEGAKEAGARIIAIVSRDGGRAKELGDAVILVPVVAQARITPHAEGWQGILWHLLVNAVVEA
jgi:D-sedoheptulose 7-phosphate isomerase